MHPIDKAIVNWWRGMGNDGPEGPTTLNLTPPIRDYPDEVYVDRIPYEPQERDRNAGWTSLGDCDTLQEALAKVLARRVSQRGQIYKQLRIVEDECLVVWPPHLGWTKQRGYHAAPQIERIAHRFAGIGIHYCVQCGVSGRALLDCNHEGE